MSIAERIKKARKEKGMTQKQLAEEIGVATGTIQQYELGKREPRMLQMTKMARSLDIPVSYFLEAEDEDLLIPAVKHFFIKRLSDKLASSAPEDLVEMFGTSTPFSEIISGKVPLTYSKAVDIAGRVGLSMDYLTGRVKHEDEVKISIGDFNLEDQLQEAEAALLDTVRRICGMDETNVAKPYATGKLREIWNPEKINIVREYLEDSAEIIKKLIAAQKGVDHGSHTED